MIDDGGTDTAAAEIGRNEGVFRNKWLEATNPSVFCFLGEGISGESFGVNFGNESNGKKGHRPKCVKFLGIAKISSMLLKVKNQRGSSLEGIDIERRYSTSARSFCNSFRSFCGKSHKYSVPALPADPSLPMTWLQVLCIHE